VITGTKLWRVERLRGGNREAISYVERQNSAQVADPFPLRFQGQEGSKKLAIQGKKLLFENCAS